MLPFAVVLTGFFISILLIVIFSYLISNLNSIKSSENVNDNSVSIVLIFDVIVLIMAVVLCIYCSVLLFVGQGTRENIKKALVKTGTAGLIGDTSEPTERVKWSDILLEPAAPTGTKESVFDKFKNPFKSGSSNSKPSTNGLLSDKPV
jgi:hypothetical protein